MVQVDFFDKTRLLAPVVNGVIHGLARFYVPEYDPETNLPTKKAKVLQKAQLFASGQGILPYWTFTLNGLIMYHETEHENDFKLLLVENSMQTFDIYKGYFDESDDMFVKARQVQVNELSMKFDLMTLGLAGSNDAQDDYFDYDMLAKIKTDATLAKLNRFFEFITLDSNQVKSKYSPLEQVPVDIDAPLIVSEMKKLQLEQDEDLYEMKCPMDISGKCFAAYEGNGEFQGDSTLKMYSDLTYNKLVEANYFNESYLESNTNVSKARWNDYLAMELVYYLVPQDSILKMKGNFVDRKLQGPVEITYVSGKTIQGFAVNGTMHGLARFLGWQVKVSMRSRYLPVIKDDSGISYAKEKTVNEVYSCGIYQNGVLDGPFWEFLQGANFHFGIIDRKDRIKFLSNFTTGTGAYVTQDKKTALVGTFFEGNMQKAQYSSIDKLEYVHQVPIPIFK